MPVFQHSWKTYERKGAVQARPYVPGEDLTDISVNPAYDVPESGDMICRDPDNLEDQWLVKWTYFREKYRI